MNDVTDTHCFDLQNENTKHQQQVPTKEKKKDYFSLVIKERVPNYSHERERALLGLTTCS